MKDAIKNLIYQSTNGWTLDFKLLCGFPPIIIYQMGKVGSTTIYKSLKASEIHNPVYHVHFLTQRGIQVSKEDYKKTGAKMPPHIQQSDLIYKRLTKINDSSKKSWKIITLTRELVGREIASYFQTLKRRHPEKFDSNGSIKDLDEVIKTLVDGFLKFDESKDYACNWFDNELKQAFDIDIFAHPFDRKKGYSIIRNNKAEVLVIRLESLDSCIDDALASFLGSGIKSNILRGNTGDDKEYSDDYKTVKDRILLPESCFSKIYSSRLMKHFYAEYEIQRLIQRWSKKV